MLIYRDGHVHVYGGGRAKRGIECRDGVGHGERGVLGGCDRQRGPGTSYTGSWAASGQALLRFEFPLEPGRYSVQLDVHSVGFGELRRLHVVDRLFVPEHGRAGGHRALRRDGIPVHQPAAERRKWNSVGIYSLIAGQSYTVTVVSQPGHRALRGRGEVRYLGGAATFRRSPGMTPSRRQ